jgi:predicted ATPase/class 3 adenylate cyclase
VCIVTIEPSAPAITRTLAFLFTDVEGSTRLWESHPEAMRHSLAQHDRILIDAVESARGRVIKTTGDGLMAVFDTARDGVVACVAAQMALAAATWGETGPLRVRMGLHVGEGAGDGHDYHGPAVNRAARVMAAGHGGQILLSGPTAALVMDQLPAGTALQDLGEHLLKDLARPEHVYQVDHPAMPGAFLPLTTVDVRQASLPPEPSAFLGRGSERTWLAGRLVDPDVRLLTITGPGGIGKTRLAMRAARDVEAAFAAGVAFVDLAMARDASAVLTEIGRALGYSDASDDAQLDELVTHLGRQPRLLILDTLEQVTGVAPTLVRLLQGCPGLTLLVTSREPLHVREEQLLPLLPLAVPSLGHASASSEAIERFEAVLLFVDRARAVRREVRITDDNAAVVAEICRRLEGLPLAIELAAARLRVFSLDALRDRLHNRLRGLGSGARDLPERQQTLRSTIDWSYQLLSPGEQRLFVMMACFRGAEIEAVEAVVAELADRGPDVDPVDGLVSLTDKSLLRQTATDAQAPRFEMLESVREFATELLERDDDLVRLARSAHAAYFEPWAERIAAEARGPDRALALQRLAIELDNLRAAWQHDVAEADLDGLQALLIGLEPLYDTRGWYRALTDLAQDVLDVLDRSSSSPERDLLAITLRSNQARALTAMEGYTEEVEAAYERLLASVEGAPVPRVYPVLRGLATLYVFRADHVRSRQLGRQILDLAEVEGDPQIRVDGHLLYGQGLAFGGRIEDGIPELEAAVEWWQTHPYDRPYIRMGPDSRVSTLTALSLLTWWQGRLATSVRHSAQALELAGQLGHPSTTGYALFHAALLHHWRREPARARELAVRVIDVAEEHELHIWRAVGSVVLGASAVALGLGPEGLDWVAKGLEQYRGLRTPPIFWPFLLQTQAEACGQAGRPEEGLEAVAEALTLAPFLPDLHVVQGELFNLVGRVAEAVAAWEVAVEAARRWGATMSELRAARRLFEADDGSSRTRRADRLAALRRVLDDITDGGETAELIAIRDLLIAHR